MNINTSISDRARELLKEKIIETTAEPVVAQVCGILEDGKTETSLSLENVTKPVAEPVLT